MGDRTKWWARAAIVIAAIAPHASAQSVSKQEWVAFPTPAEVVRLYPELAARLGMAGRVVMRCTVKIDGSLTGCWTVSEHPQGMGFGAAALKLSPMFKMRPMTGSDEAPVDIPILFELEVKARGGSASVKSETTAQTDAMAQYNLGLNYLEGRGVPRDDSQAFAWFLKAAEQGYPPAMVDLSEMYSNGRGRPEDKIQAAAWMRKAADAKLSLAEVILGVMYFDGAGVPTDKTEAVAWWRKAAEQGDPQGMISLGGAYTLGQGAPQDYGQAMVWYQKAGDLGLALANIIVGERYESGYGVARDPAVASIYYGKAVDQGSAEARYHMAKLYLGSHGGPRDDVKALIWLDLFLSSAAYADREDHDAAENDRPLAIASRTRLAAALTPTQRAQAKSLELDWTAKHPGPMR